MELKSLGPYDVLSPLGAGGMGEVYRAKDTKLGREVALKILPVTFTNDPERVARFRREAQVLASLNHPHIAQIYGLDEANGTQFLVLELVDGESLDKRIARGRIPVDEALGIAKQIADALEAAHEKGIIHRDLKPANIALTNDGTVKVLDFGLAKAMEPSGSTALDVTNSPTITTPAVMTGIGMILGTAAYMSPEQAKGRPADKRSDVWAFGCVLYEMLAGRRAFGGEDVGDTLAAVLRGEPDWALLPRDLHPDVSAIVRGCLAKDRTQRIGEASTLLFLLNPSRILPTSTAPTNRRTVLVAVCALLIGAGATGAAVWALMRQPSSQPAHTVRLMIAPTASQPLMVGNPDRNIVVTPDGTNVIYLAGNGGGAGQLMVRPIGQLASTPLRGIDQARFPFTSPDGRWIGFFENGQLKKVSITGGPPLAICPSTAPRGATWGLNNTIIFASNDPGTGLLSVSAAGGAPQVLTKPNASHGEIDHYFPSLLPGGAAVLFTIWSGSADRSQIAVLNLKTGEQKTLIPGGSAAEYLDTGYLIYAAGGALRAVRFDVATLDVRGDPVPVVEDVAMASTGAANYSVSSNGTLVYVTGSATAKRALVWVDRHGQEQALDAPLHDYVIARISPDGTRVALDARDQDSDIWIWDLNHRALTRLTFDPSPDTYPVWTPDSRRILFTSGRAGSPSVFAQSSEGTGAVDRVTNGQNALRSLAISPDGRLLVIDEATVQTGVDLSVVRLDSGHIERLVEGPQAQTSADVSPDGRWIAYQSNESGRNQVYVRPFPNAASGRWTVSTDAGSKPVWARNGRELFYIDGDGYLVSTPIRTVPAFAAGTPTRLVSTQYFNGGAIRNYDVAPDGQRFLMLKTMGGDTVGSANIVVVEHWLEELKARVPAK